MKSFSIFLLTAMAEILGCYAYYYAFRMERSLGWLIPGTAILVLFAWLLTLHPVEGAGRVYAAYGGIYIAASLVWLVVVERVPVTRWDLIGTSLCLAGAAVIYFAPKIASS